MENSKTLIVSYFVLLVLYGVTEIIFQNRFSTMDKKKIDKGFLFIVLPFYLSIYLAPVEFMLFNNPINTLSIIVGFSVLLAGIIIRFLGFAALRKNFSIAIELRGNKLVTSGIYKYVRHPMYISVLIITISGAIIFECIFIWIFVTITFLGIFYRIKKEEEFLLKNIPDYKNYSQKVKGLVPFIY